LGFGVGDIMLNGISFVQKKKMSSNTLPIQKKMLNFIVVSYSCFLLHIVYFKSEKYRMTLGVEHLDYGCKL
jgi:hypothetical protein